MYIKPLCKENQCTFKPVYEDHILLGNLYYGEECSKCGKRKAPPPGTLELGVYK